MAGKPGRKPKKSLDEQIEEITNDIELYRNSISTLEIKREELIKAKRDRDLSELYEIIEDNSLSIETVKDILEKYCKDERKEQKLEVI